MSLTDEELERLADVVRLQPTKNSELGERWGMESGSDVHGYLENHLSDYYYRDDNSLIRATSEAAELTGVEPGVEDDGEEGGIPDRIRVPELHSQVFAVLAGPDERSESVVSVLQKLRERFDVDPEVGDVRRALQSLRRKNVVEVEYRTVPTFRLAVERDAVDVGVSE
ncbi:hypothetical protein HUG10_06520 [Halorarum halophilum]|uniref:Uncharacterized protein n=1 Tax=Halorarum halophilum TaxID=2743090 RepID=A0A7D5KEY8_9EURY|nr:DUF5797 family protein [Halobaculum halophilum]QLG27216.1 hypothetical protein HUG10_06520 [Halobaculum halophilum]